MLNYNVFNFQDLYLNNLSYMALIYSKGQLGTGQLDDHSDPIQVEALAGIKIVKIAAGKPP